MDDEHKIGDPFKKVFYSEDAINKWMVKQSRHPWLSIILINVEESDVDNIQEGDEGE
jgi:hypothetical protein